MSETLPDKSNEALVSIIIPFFNREKFLAESIESVLAQTYGNRELILVDDGSTDKSPQIARNYVEKYPDRIFLCAHENGKNHGASSSRNLGIKQAKGDFITFLDSDDVFLPETLKIELAAFDRNPQADVVCGTLQYWFSWSDEGRKNERDFIVNLGLTTERLYQPPSLLIHNLRAGGRKPGIGCVILRSEFAKKFSLFEDDFNYVCEDQIFWAKISLQAKIYLVDACLAKYRQHADSSVALLIKSGKTVSDWEKFSAWLENYLIENKVENRDLWEAVRLYRKENNYRIKYERLLNLYHRLLPYHLRYRIRDVIIAWRTRS
jgi:glycosyltransferase involved in cell wall biosynthesis